MARSKVLVFQHVPYEPLGTLDPLLKESGCRIRYINFCRDAGQRPSLDGYTALIILGGPMSAEQLEQFPNLQTEIEIIRDALARDMSVLGICLGAQLLASALGGSVSRNHKTEIGWFDVELTEAGIRDPVLGGFARRQRVFQWHEDGIALPPGCEHLARSAASEVQAFRYGEHAYGFQFHLEVDASLIDRWLRVPANQPVLEREADNLKPALIREQASDYIGPLTELSRQTFTQWINRFEPLPKRRMLPSR
jgi:GMP synthase (glutamine-hydrolysing)